MTTLRCFGLVWQRDAVAVIVRTLAPVTLAGLVLMTLSGSLLFASGADRYATSSAFEVKMVAYVLAITAQGAAYVMAVRDKSREHLATPRAWTIMGGLLFLLWLSVGISGRFIAFY
jgi:hypothetical protein